MAITIRWDITKNCNLHCKHCSAYEDMNNSNNSQLALQDIISIMQKFSGEKINLIKLLGGEPLLRNDLNKIIIEANVLNIPIGFTTNGTVPFGKDIQELIIANKLRYITFSLDSENDSINATLRSPNTVKGIKDNIKYVSELKQKHQLPLKIAINCVINKNNFLDINNLLDFAIQNYIDKISFSNLVPRGRAKHLDSLIVTSSQLIQTALIIANHFKNNNELISIEPSFAPALLADYIRVKYDMEFPEITYRCRASTELCYIDEIGRLYPCESIISKYPISKNSLLEYSFRDIWNSEEFNKVFQEVEYGVEYSSELCKSCKYRFKTCYPCVNWSMKPQICEQIKQEIPNIFEVNKNAY